MTKTISLLLALCAAAFSAKLAAYSLQPHLSRAMLKDIAFDSQAYFSNTSAEAYFMLDEIDLQKANACALLFKLEFKEPLAKPTLFEFYWQSAQQAYSELNKGFFIVDPKLAEPSTYVVRLCDLHKYSGLNGQLNTQDRLTGLRIDFPVNRYVSAKFSSMQLLSEHALAQLPMSERKQIVPLQAFERVASNSPDLNQWIRSAVKSALVSSVPRLGKDWPFLLVWLLLLGLLVFKLIKPRSH